MSHIQAAEEEISSRAFETHRLVRRYYQNLKEILEFPLSGQIKDLLSYLIWVTYCIELLCLFQNIIKNVALIYKQVVLIHDTDLANTNMPKSPLWQILVSGRKRYGTGAEKRKA